MIFKHGKATTTTTTTMGTNSVEDKDAKAIAEKYGSELITLRVNSKPLINSLTMMAEDYIKNAAVIVQTIEKHLVQARADAKLPLLYLIDSIVKNVKRDYVALFQQNIVSTFCGVFEKVDDNTRKQMFKLKQTWGDIFPQRKLHAIDIKAHELDSGWPLSSAHRSIHLNPKFLKNSSSPPASPTMSALSTSSILTPTQLSLTLGSLDLDESKMREQLLMKQKELLELQQKKLELELLQTKALLGEESHRKQGLEEKDGKEEQLLKQAEMAKQKTTLATSIIAKAGASKHSGQSSTSSVTKEKTPTPDSRKQDQKTTSLVDNEGYLPDPRLARRSTVKAPIIRPSLQDQSKAKSPNPIKEEKKSPVKEEKKSSTRIKEEKKSPTPIKEEKRSPKSPKNVAQTSNIKEKIKIEMKDTNSQSVDNKESKSKKKRYDQEDEIGRSPKDKVSKDRSRTHESKISPSPEKSKDRESREKSKSRTKSDSSSSSEQKDKERDKRSRSQSQHERDKKAEKEFVSSRNMKETKDKSEKGGREARSKNDTDKKEIESKSKTEKVEKDRDKETFIDRRSAVLSRSYRKRPDQTFEEKKEKEKPNKSKTSSDSLPGDTDLRYQGLRDVDLRREGSESSDEPSAKRSRKLALIDDLFGQEDVDLRQPVGTTNWSELKKPRKDSIGNEQETEDANQDAVASNMADREVRDQDIRQILGDVGNRPPPPISPANSVDSNRSSHCDSLGRPLVFSRLPDNPDERKRSLNTRSLSIDPVEQFRMRYLERPTRVTPVDLKLAFNQAKVDLDAGLLTSEQYNVILKQLIQLNEVEKIREFQERRLSGSGGPLQAPNPWASGNNIWAAGERSNFLPRATGDFPGGSRFPGPWAHDWAAKPVGPNPFEAALSNSLPPEDLIPEVNPVELKIAERDSDSTIPLDKVIRQIRFYGGTTIVFIGMLGDEPREISFQKMGPKTVFIDKKGLLCFIGEDKIFHLDGKKHSIRIGTPKRELYIDNEPYEASFTGMPVRVRLDGRWHYFALEGPPPQVEIGKAKRHDLVAGRVTLFIDSNSTSIYLDEKPQILDLGGVPVILRFCNNFHAFTLNGRSFATSFGGPPMSVTLRNGRQHFIRLAGVSRATELAMKFRSGESVPEFPNFAGRGRGGFGPGRGGPARGRGGVLPSRSEAFERPHRQEDNMEVPSEDNPLDVLATIFPTTELKPSRNQKNAYKSEAQGVDESSKNEDKTSTQALNVQDLLSKLVMAGLLPSSDSKSTPESKKKVEDPETAVQAEKPPEEKDAKEVPMEISDVQEPQVEKVKPKPEPPLPPPLEVVNISLSDNLKERRNNLVDHICIGVQCGSCGLRFAPDQSCRYTQHLDWHFRLNRREKSNSRKAQSRRWYYDLSDWIQFEEIEDLEERAASLFEFQEAEKADGEEKETDVLLNPDAYTVPAKGFDKATCPQCGEGFESFYDSEEDEWRIRDAVIDSDIDTEPKLFHPICHQDYIASLDTQPEAETDGPDWMDQNADVSDIIKPMEEDIIDDSKTVEPEPEEDEVLILKEGKKEVVLMEIDVEDDENVCKDEMIHSDLEKISKDNETEKDNNLKENNGIVSVDNNNTNIPSNKSILSPIVIHVEDDSNIPGITGSNNASGVFDFALSSSTNSQNLNSKPEEPVITYNSMQFDFPKVKVEPIEWDALDENQVIMSKDFFVDGNRSPMDVTLEDDDTISPPVGTPQPSNITDVDIDLTAEDDDTSQSGPLNSLETAMDGNLEVRSEASTVPLMTVPTKIRINISGLDKSSGSVSPAHISSSQENTSSKKSPSPHTDTTDGVSQISNPIDNLSSHDDDEKKLEEIKRLKPRLFGKKLVNCPPKMTGKEESGLCTIC